MIHGIVFTFLVAVVWPTLLWLWARKRVNEIRATREVVHKAAHDSVMKTIHQCETIKPAATVVKEKQIAVESSH